MVPDSFISLKEVIVNKFLNLIINSGHLESWDSTRDFLDVTLANDKPIVDYIPNFRLICVRNNNKSFLLRLITYHGLVLAEEELSSASKAAESPLLKSFDSGRFAAICEGISPQLLRPLPSNYVLERVFVEPLGNINRKVVRSHACLFAVSEISESGRVVCSECMHLELWTKLMDDTSECQLGVRKKKISKCIKPLDAEIKIESLVQNDLECNSDFVSDDLVLESVQDMVSSVVDNELKVNDKESTEANQHDNENNIVNHSVNAQSSKINTKSTRLTNICPNCNREFKNDTSFQKHMCDEQNSKRNKALKLLPEAGDGVPTSGGKIIYRCVLCYKRYGSRKLYQHHMSVHENESETFGYNDPVACPVCKYLCLSRYELNPHIEDVHGRNHKLCCPKCPMMIQMCSMNCHLTKYHRIPSHLCQTCGRNFVFRSDLRNHVIMTHGTKAERERFVCETCGRWFALKRNLKMHVANTHTEAKPLVCKVCQRAFGVKFQFRKHMLIHMDFKPFKCSRCNYRAVRKDNVIQHLRKVHQRCQTDGDDGGEVMVISVDVQPTSEEDVKEQSIQFFELMPQQILS